MTNTIDVARELMRLYDGVDADNCGVNLYRMIRRKIQETFPGITNGEYERAHHVMMAQMEMFVEDASMRIERMNALFPNSAGKLTGPFHDAFNMAFAECNAVGKMTAENVFPAKPDKSKS